MPSTVVQPSSQGHMDISKFGDKKVQPIRAQCTSHHLNTSAHFATQPKVELKAARRNAPGFN